MNIQLRARSPKVEAFQHLYRSTAQEVADLVDGIVDTPTGAIHYPTADGVKVAPVGSWFVCIDGGEWTHMSDADVQAAFEPIDPAAARAAMGGRWWSEPPASLASATCCERRA